MSRRRAWDHGGTQDQDVRRAEHHEDLGTKVQRHLRDDPGEKAGQNEHARHVDRVEDGDGVLPPPERRRQNPERRDAHEVTEEGDLAQLGGEYFRERDGVHA
jgi:hypothetical protein